MIRIVPIEIKMQQKEDVTKISYENHIEFLKGVMKYKIDYDNNIDIDDNQLTAIVKKTMEEINVGITIENMIQKATTNIIIGEISDEEKSTMFIVNSVSLEPEVIRKHICMSLEEAALVIKMKALAVEVLVTNNGYVFAINTDTIMPNKYVIHSKCTEYTVKDNTIIMQSVCKDCQLNIKAWRFIIHCVKANKVDNESLMQCFIYLNESMMIDGKWLTDTVQCLTNMILILQSIQVKNLSLPTFLHPQSRPIGSLHLDIKQALGSYIISIDNYTEEERNSIYQHIKPWRTISCDGINKPNKISFRDTIAVYCYNVYAKKMEEVSCNYVAITHSWGRLIQKDSYIVSMVDWKLPIIEDVTGRIDSETTLHQKLEFIAKACDMQYVWIDWLSICQDMDMFNELDIMSQPMIFSKAKCIVAWWHDVPIGAINSVERLHNTLEAWHITPNEEYLHDEEVKNILISSAIINCIWFNSVWTMQEAIIANRQQNGTLLYNGVDRLCSISVNKIVDILSFHLQYLDLMGTKSSIFQTDQENLKKLSRYIYMIKAIKTGLHMVKDVNMLTLIERISGLFITKHKELGIALGYICAIPQEIAHSLRSVNNVIAYLGTQKYGQYGVLLGAINTNDNPQACLVPRQVGWIDGLGWKINDDILTVEWGSYYHKYINPICCQNFHEWYRRADKHLWRKIPQEHIDNWLIAAISQDRDKILVRVVGLVLANDIYHIEAACELTVERNTFMEICIQYRKQGYMVIG